MKEQNMGKRKEKIEKIDLTIRSHGVLGSRHKVSVVKGEGSKDFQFPDDLVQRAIERAKGTVIKAPEADSDTTGGAGDSFLFGRGLWDVIKPAVPKVPNPDFQALIGGSDSIQRYMVQRQFDALMEQLFGEMEGSAKSAAATFPARFLPAIADHQRQVSTLRSKVEEALPEVVKEVARRNPGVPVSELLQASADILLQELAPLLSVLGIYTSVFRQYQDGRFTRKLEALNQYMSSCFRLVMTPDLPTASFKVGDLLLSGFGGPGLGTIPAARGPIGLHLLLVPFDMLDWLSVGRPLLAHESRHQLFSDIRNLETEMQKALKDAIIKACAPGGGVKLTTAKTKVGRYSVDTRDLLIKLVADCIGEIDADIGGGVLFTGPAYLYSMLLSFPAMLIRNGRVKDAKQLLRASSVYNLIPQADGSAALEFESHPPDWIRTHIVAAALDEIGFTAEADKLRELADAAVGQMPEFIKWTDADGKSSTVVSLSAKDIKAIAPTVAKTLIRAPLPSLNNKSTGDVVMWTPARQAKVDLLTATLLAGKSTIPSDQGDILPTYVGAAGAKAYWEAVHNQDGMTFLPQLEENTLLMLETLRKPAA
jgi:hypothetical protein